MWRKVLEMLFFTILIAAALKVCVVDAFKIPTDSMAESLRAGDYLLVNKLIYGARTPEKIFNIPLPQIHFPRFSSVRRGDVVVFYFPGEPDEVVPSRRQFLVKRCIGIPSDTVETINRNLIVNGYRAVNSFSQFDSLRFFSIVPYKGMTIVLDSESAKQWGVFIRREGNTFSNNNGTILINDTAADSYTVQQNYYFVVGDNAKNSYDSRSWGFVPEQDIIGKATMIYWSKGEDGIRWSRIGTFIK
jgi:signal peptidase I